MKKPKNTVRLLNLEGLVNVNVKAINRAVQNLKFQATLGTIGLPAENGILTWKSWLTKLKKKMHGIQRPLHG